MGATVTAMNGENAGLAAAKICIYRDVYGIAVETTAPTGAAPALI